MALNVKQNHSLPVQTVNIQHQGNICYLKNRLKVEIINSFNFSFIMKESHLLLLNLDLEGSTLTLVQYSNIIDEKFSSALLFEKVSQN